VLNGIQITVIEPGDRKVPLPMWPLFVPLLSPSCNLFPFAPSGFLAPSAPGSSLYSLHDANMSFPDGYDRYEKIEKKEVPFRSQILKVRKQPIVTRNGAKVRVK
jgi:hypothetical protein